MGVDAVHISRLILSVPLAIFLFFTEPGTILGGQQRVSMDLKNADLVETILHLAEMGAVGSGQ